MVIMFNRPSAEQIAELVNKYGKKFAQELLDFMVINNSITSKPKANYEDKKMRELLLKNKVIKRSTNIIQTWPYAQQVGDEIFYGLIIRNGNGKVLFSLKIKQSDLPEITEILNNAS